MTNDDSVRQAYRAAAQASGEPSPQLDARILQAAHAALQTPAPKPARWSWLVLPFSAAAVAVLVTTLLLQSRQAPPAPNAVAGAPVATHRPQATKPEQLNDSKIADAKPTPTAKRRADAQQEQQALQIAAAEDAAKAERRSESAARTGAAEQAQQKMQAAKIAAAPAPTSDIASAAPVPAPVATAAPPQVASIPPPPAATRQEAPAEQLAEAEHAQTRARKSEALGALAKARSADQPTAKQIEEIRKLQREGKLDAAKKSLAELRKTFPQYTVPEDLRALIKLVPEENKTQP
jgi:hypothetical protein